MELTKVQDGLGQEGKIKLSWITDWAESGRDLEEFGGQAAPQGQIPAQGWARVRGWSHLPGPNMRVGMLCLWGEWRHGEKRVVSHTEGPDLQKKAAW